MNEDAISRAEHEEFVRRLDQENERQNKRLELLETNIESVRSLSQSVERLAVNMENMLKEQERQGKRLEKLEGMDGEKWRSAASYVLTVVIGLVLGVVARMVGM